jgi:glycosyltransferase involved in cell wall biosynthesis
MKLLFYINTISNGGAERVIVNLATELSKRGHNCTLLTTFREDWEYQYGENVKRLSFYEERPNSFFKRNVEIIFLLNKLVRKNKYDLLITFMNEPNIRGIISTFGTSTKSVISVRNDPKKIYSKRIHRFFANILFKKAHLAVFQTEEAKSFFCERIRSNSIVVYNPVNDIFYNTTLNNDRFGIVTMGRLVEQKNHLMLLKAYSRISHKTKEDLYIYGTGDQIPLLKLAELLGISNRVHLMGQCNDVASVLSRSKLFVLSSDYEGMPNALMEAMAVGIPCISTDCPCGGPRALFPPNIHEYLSPIGNEVALAERILKILSSEDEEIRVAHFCKEGAKIFESSRVFDEWENVLTNLIS